MNHWAGTSPAGCTNPPHEHHREDDAVKYNVVLADKVPVACRRCQYFFQSSACTLPKSDCGVASSACRCSSHRRARAGGDVSDRRIKPHVQHFSVGVEQRHLIPQSRSRVMARGCNPASIHDLRTDRTRPVSLQSAACDFNIHSRSRVGS